MALQTTVLDGLLTHPSHEIRASAFSLLVSSQTTTKPLSTAVMQLLKLHLPAIYSDYEPKFRNDVLGCSKDLIRRVKSVIAVAKRALKRQKHHCVDQHATGKVMDDSHPNRRFGPESKLGDEEEARDVLEQHTSFFDWYCGFLRGELVPSASYPRHITATKAMIFLLRIAKGSGVADEEIDREAAELFALSPAWTRLVLDLVMDPFTDVRETAVTVLSMLPAGLVTTQQRNLGAPYTLHCVLEEMCARAQDLATQTGRADYGDGAARAHGLLCAWTEDQGQKVALVSTVLQRLEYKISEAESDLGHAAVEKPVHGDFASLR